MRIGFVLGLALGVATLTGCAMTGGDDDDGGATPKNVDSVHMANGDVLVGELDLPRISLQTEYLEEVVLERRHIEKLEILSTGKVKVVTRHGDILHGKAAFDSPTGSRV